jgi:hypothetical protein
LEVNGKYDPGIPDKRLLIVDAEFASLLTIMARSGNTLSPVIRLAWDSQTLHNTTKTSPVAATDPHVSFIGHITPQELRRDIDDVQLVNGFFNRFLPVMVKRSKDLPHGGALDDQTFAALAARLRTVLEVGRTIERMERTATARKHWETVYPKLKESRLGLVGAVTSRAAAQVTRISCIYAVLDGSSFIEVHHTKAALAVWKYVEQSAAYLFGGGFGDPDVEKLWAALLVAGSKGLSTTDIQNIVFAKHSRRATNALTTLQEQGYVWSKDFPTKGRPRTMWYAVEAKRTEDTEDEE